MSELFDDVHLKGRRTKGYFSRKCDVERLIKNKFYFGMFEYRGALKELHGDYPIKADSFELMITEQIWKENQEILASRNTHQKPDTKKQFLFSNLLVCGKCNKLFYGNNTTH